MQGSASHSAQQRGIRGPAVKRGDLLSERGDLMSKCQREEEEEGEKEEEE